jgi:hypothetical protein
MTNPIIINIHKIVLLRVESAAILYLKVNRKLAKIYRQNKPTIHGLWFLPMINTIKKQIGNSRFRIFWTTIMPCIVFESIVKSFKKIPLSIFSYFIKRMLLSAIKTG